MALTERRARKPFTQSTEKVPKPEHLRPARTCACEPYQKAYVRTCAHVTEAHPFVHSAPCAAAPVRTPPVARDRWRDVGRGRHQEVCRWAQRSFAARPPRSTRWAGRASHHGAPGGSRGLRCYYTCDRRFPGAKCAVFPARIFPGAKCTVFVLYWAHQGRVTRHGRRAPLVARAGTGWRARRPAHDAPPPRRRPTACCRGPGAAPAARLTTSLRRT